MSVRYASSSERTRVPRIAACPLSHVSPNPLLSLNLASLVTVRLPRAVQDALTVGFEPLNSTVVILGCAALPAVCTPVADVFRVSVVNNSDKPIEMFAGFPVAFVNTVRPASKSSQSTATATRIPLESKLQKVLHELKIDSFPTPSRTSSSCSRWLPSTSIFSPSATQMSALRI